MTSFQEWLDGDRAIIELEKKKMQQPTIGRIVIYHHPGSADGKYAPQQSPAIIREVDLNVEGRVQIFVFGPKGQHQDWADYGTGPSQWSWPEIKREPIKGIGI